MVAGESELGLVIYLDNIILRVEFGLVFLATVFEFDFGAAVVFMFNLDDDGVWIESLDRSFGRAVGA